MQPCVAWQHILDGADTLVHRTNTLVHGISSLPHRCATQ